MSITSFTGSATPLADIDLPKVGRTIGVGEDEIHAILDTETSGAGFDATGRPKMLFEPHVFWRLLTQAQQTTIRARAANLGIAYPKWGQQPYPRDSYTHLQQAMALDYDLALQSASWGLGQVMGYNFLLAGYTSAEAMVQDFMAGEENQLEGMVTFITNTGLAAKLRAHDWAGFAAGYNGPGFAKNGYATKLATAFARWQKIKDTPYP